MRSGWLDLCLYPNVQLHIMEHFIQNPNIRQNQSQIARKMDLLQASISRNITKLVALGLLLEERNGRQAIYRLNSKALLVSHILQPLIESSKNLVPHFVERSIALLPLASQNNIVRVILFGSAARGDLHIGSDVDLLFIVRKKTESIENQLHELMVTGGFQKGLKIGFFLETQSDFLKNKKNTFIESAKIEGIDVWKGKAS